MTVVRGSSHNSMHRHTFSMSNNQYEGDSTVVRGDRTRITDIPLSSSSYYDENQYHRPMSNPSGKSAISQVLDLSMQMNHTTQQQQHPLSRPTRRSHRPRGCRGGRKNKKGSRSDTNHLQDLPQQQLHHLSYYNNVEEIRSLQLPPLASYRSFSEGSLLPPHTSNEHNVNRTNLLKGDLSPYQHLNLSNTSWNYGLQQLQLSYTNEIINGNNSGTPSRRCGDTIQIQTSPLPPPVPSALFDSHHDNVQSMNGTTGIVMKMLPSFDDDGDDYDEETSGDSVGDDQSNDDSMNSRNVGISRVPTILSSSKSSICQKQYSIDKNNYHVTLKASNTDTLTVSSSHSRSSSSDDECDDEDGGTDTANVRINTTRNSSWNSNDFPKHQTPYQKQQRLSLLPFLHMRIALPLPTSTCTTPATTTSSTSTFGSLFVTSPRSFLMGATKGRNSYSTTSNCNSGNNTRILLEVQQQQQHKRQDQRQHNQFAW